MRTIRLVRHKATTVKGRSCANTIRDRSGGSKYHRTTHTVSCCADFPGHIDGFLCIKECDEGLCIDHVRRSCRSNLVIRHDPGPYFRITEAFSFCDYRRLSAAIKMVHT